MISGPGRKRCFDLGLALLLLLVLGPLLLVLWAVVAVRMGRPALFRQVRAGRDARPFTLYKFRSMTDARDATGELLPDADRLPAFGRFLRRSSLDELPQLFNVLKGDMSFVGPRPLYLDYVPHYSPRQRRRLEVLPGITGLAQVEGRTSIGWARRFDLDVAYVEGWSLALDLKILVLTARRVILREGISRDGLDGAGWFQGTGED